MLKRKKKKVSRLERDGERAKSQAVHDLSFPEGGNNGEIVGENLNEQWKK